ncbi:hypothetical protein LCGC14_0275600 [marine sediment metagenome]|uniref:Class I SAM-dependent methyltransferase n=1 Tax=marine sediment metagenome TaxID=412755 RepID=A0A0F9TXJ0_9ZZZZ
MAFSLSRNEPIRAIMLKLQEDLFGSVSFVETGTRHGSGVTWASINGFYPCYTIDILDREPKGQFLDHIRDGGIFYHIGNSPNVLRGLIEWIDDPAIFWLDAHGPKDVGTPVLEEIEIILDWGKQAFIFIDDISIFSRGRFYDPRYSSWPKIEEVYKALGDRPSLERADVLVSFPRVYKGSLADYAEMTKGIMWFVDKELGGKCLR